MAALLASDTGNPRFGFRPGPFGVSSTALALLAVAACEPPRLEVLPSRVQVDVSTLPSRFRVAAHLRARDGKLMSNPMEWHLSGSGINLIPTTENHVYLVEVVAGAQPGRSATIHVKAGKYRAESVITFLLGTPLSTDRAWADYQDADYPSVALIGGWTGGCVHDSLFPFVRASDLGEWTTQPCGQPVPPATIFAGNRSPYFETPWPRPSPPPPPPPPHDELDGRLPVSGDPPQSTPPNAPPPGYRTVVLKGWRLAGVSEGLAATRLEEERQVANARYAEALTGIFFSVEAGIGSIPYPSTGCDELRNLLIAYPPGPDETVVNVYFSRNLGATSRGWWCGGPSETGTYPGNLILISTETHTSAKTLAHELGHALALREPWASSGHADVVKGMTSDNIMWGGLDDQTAAGRWRFSVGQVFRMHFDTRSLLAPSHPIDCGCDPYVRRSCPRLAADVTPLNDANARLPGGSCP